MKLLTTRGFSYNGVEEWTRSSGHGNGKQPEIRCSKHLNPEYSVPISPFKA